MTVEQILNQQLQIAGGCADPFIRAGFATIGQMVVADDKELLAIKGIGWISIQTLRRRIATVISILQRVDIPTESKEPSPPEQ